MRRLDDVLRQAFQVNDETVVLAGNLDFAGPQVFDRVIGAAVPAHHLAGPAAKRQSQQLVAEADAENRLTPIQQVAQHRHRVSTGRGWVTWTVRQKDAVRAMADDLFRRGGSGNYGDPAAMCGEHPQDVALDSVVDRYDAIAGTLSETITALSIPHSFAPLVGLAAGHFFGQVHPFKTRPYASPCLEGRHIDPSLGIVRDDTIGRSEIANTHRQLPGIDPRDPDETVAFEPNVERLGCAIARRFGHRYSQDQSSRCSGGGFDILLIRAHIANMGKGEGDDLSGIGRVGQDLLISGDGGVEADFTRRRPDRAEATAPKQGAIGEDERSVAVGWSRRRVAHRREILLAGRSLPEGHWRVQGANGRAGARDTSPGLSTSTPCRSELIALSNT